MTNRVQRKKHALCLILKKLDMPAETFYANALFSCMGTQAQASMLDGDESK